MKQILYLLFFMTMASVHVYGANLIAENEFYSIMHDSDEKFAASNRNFDSICAIVPADTITPRGHHLKFVKIADTSFVPYEMHYGDKNRDILSNSQRCWSYYNGLTDLKDFIILAWYGGPWYEEYDILPMDTSMGNSTRVNILSTDAEHNLIVSMDPDTLGNVLVIESLVTHQKQSIELKEFPSYFNNPQSLFHDVHFKNKQLFVKWEYFPDKMRTRDDIPNDYFEHLPVREKWFDVIVK